MRRAADQLEEDDEFDVWRSNWKTVTAFLMLETQWRAVAGPGGLFWTGLDYTAAAALFAGKSKAKFHRLIDELQIMELEALPILNAERET